MNKLGSKFEDDDDKKLAFGKMYCMLRRSNRFSPLGARKTPLVHTVIGF